MGRLHKRHNWKARLVEGKKYNEGKNEKTILKDGVTDLVENKAVDEKDLNYGCSLDGSNALVLPSKKGNKEEKIFCLPAEKKRLSKKSRKRLEKIVERKKKKSERAAVLKLLAQTSVSEDEIARYNSVSRIGQINSNTMKRKMSNSVEEVEIQSLVKRGRKKGKRERLRKKLKTMKEDVQVEECQAESSDTDVSGDDNEGKVHDETTELTLNEVTSLDENDHENNGYYKNDSTNVPNSSSNSVESVNNSKETLPENIPTITLESSSCLGKAVDQGVEKPAEEDMPFKKSIYVEVTRDPEIQTVRLQLPILGEEQAVMEAIKGNEIVLLVGETGSGKTTQVPQFLYEAGFAQSGIIGVTEPRRVAAVTMSARIALEMSLPSSMISYQIRYEGNTTSETRIKFMTDGVLLREIDTDFLLSKYSVIVIDEAHERSIYTDILIGLLSRIVLLRKKQGNSLKLIIMSATLRVEDFTNNANLFTPTPPVVKVEARQFPVTVHFNKRTPIDYVNEAFRKVTKIHRTLPDGGILVFLTGRSEILSLCRKLRNTFPLKKMSKYPASGKASNVKQIDLDDYSMSENAAIINREMEDEDAEEETVSEENSETEEFCDEQTLNEMCSSPIYVLPLYSLLSNDKQKKVFESPPDGARFCVVATNVAETSLTIPNIKYVVDTGMVKRRYYDKITGVSSFKITWTSQASANQRSGRAGRVGPGHCYRLYSSAVFNNDFEEFTQPDILRRPIDDLVLQMKAINIDKVVNFPFPTSPESKVLKTAEKLLIELGALAIRRTKKGVDTSVITTLGRTMTKFPVSPRFAKMLCLGHQNNCLQYVIVIVAALTVNELFTREGSGNKEEISNISKLRRRWAGEGVSKLLGDYMVMLRAVGAAEFSGCSTKFCQSSGLRHKAMIEVRKLRVQLTNAVNSVNPDAKLYVDPKMKPPSITQTKILRQIILSCFGDNIARRMSTEECSKLDIRNAYECHLTEEPVFIHPASSYFVELPEYVVFQEIVETTKLYVKGVAVVEPEWFAQLIPQHCSFSKPLKDPPPRYDPSDGLVKCIMTVTFGVRVWSLPQQELEYPKSTEKFKWFARFLLEGQVVPKLASFSQLLLSRPSAMVKTWSKLQPRTQIFLNTLVDYDIDNEASLLALWKKDSEFLLKPYLQWLPESIHDQIKKLWPPV